MSIGALFVSESAFGKELLSGKKGGNQQKEISSMPFMSDDTQEYGFDFFSEPLFDTFSSLFLHLERSLVDPIFTPSPDKVMM